MVPVLARSAGRRSWTDPSAKARVAQTSSALMTWSVVILLPATVIIAAVGGPDRPGAQPGQPERRLQPRRHGQRDQLHAGRSFAPQILLYGFSVVLFGLLQAYRRFSGPASRR